MAEMEPVGSDAREVLEVERRVRRREDRRRHDDEAAEREELLAARLERGHGDGGPAHGFATGARGDHVYLRVARERRRGRSRSRRSGYAQLTVSMRLARPRARRARGFRARIEVARVWGVRGVWRGDWGVHVGHGRGSALG